jgi:methylmalonyl-CoA mutase, C-terminal domain
MSKEQITVLVAKPGLDGHDRGAKVITLGLRDAGMKVIYTGLRQTAKMIADAAFQEHADVICLSCLSGAHNTLFPDVVREIEKKRMAGVLILGGGNIPPEDIPFLKEKGVNAIFGPGSQIKDIASYIRSHVKTEM